MPQSFGKIDVRRQKLQILWGDNRRVDGIARQLALQHGQHLLGRVDGDLSLGLQGLTGNVRGQHDVGLSKQRASGWGLVLEDVQRCTGHVPADQRLGECGLAYDAPAGTVDDAYAGFAALQFISAQHSFGLLSGGHVERDEIGGREQGVEVRQFHTKILGILASDVRVNRHHFHVQPMGAIGHERGDPAQADQAKPLVADLGANELTALPFAGVH